MFNDEVAKFYSQCETANEANEALEKARIALKDAETALEKAEFEAEKQAVYLAGEFNRGRNKLRNALRFMPIWNVASAGENQKIVTTGTCLTFSEAGKIAQPGDRIYPVI